MPMLNYKPVTPEQFIGPARQVSGKLQRLCASLDHTNDSLAILLYGSPGVGKSALSNAVASYLGVGRHSIHRYSGTQMKIEAAEQLAGILHYKDLFSSWRMIQIEEVDEMPRVAQVRFLTLLDDIPPGNAIVCTCNSKIDDLEERFQTRFQAIEIMPPTDDEIIGLLEQVARITRQAATQIATFACGNVRAAFKDAQTELLHAL